MLCSLHIRDFVIVDRLDLEFGAGFTVLTGETGAGKSLLIDALSLVLGERSDTSWVREGAERAEISAVFDVSGNAGLRAELAGRDLLEDDQVILRRVLERAGRSRAYLNGAPATLAQLKEVGEYLVDIHGQHLHQSLMRPAAQRDLLDGFAQAMPLRELVRQAHARWQSLQRTLADFERNATGLAREREALQDQVAELARLKLAPNEWEALETEHRRLANAASLIHGADEALQLLSEGEVNVLSTLRTLLARLRHDAETDGTLVPSAELVEAGQIQLQEAAHALRHYRERVEVDPQRLAQVESRMQALHSSARKFRVKPPELADTLATAQARLAEFAHTGDAQALERQMAESLREYQALAADLSARRARAGVELGERVTSQLKRLAMSASLLRVHLEPMEEPTAFGLEQVEFQVATHQGATPRALAKVASGGELSRLSLAIQTITSELANVPTLVFDEVDAGIGGGVAEIVGRLMRALASRRQVLCVTHLPQVAAAANAQWRVTKLSTHERTASRVEALDKKSRVEEIARMLGGVEITAATRRHAAEMISLSSVLSSADSGTPP